MAGDIEKSASWATNVSNEFGQLLNTVFTVNESDGLEAMTQGIVRRYRDAGEDPPIVIYVDRDCCSKDGQPKPLKVIKHFNFLFLF